MAFTQEDIDELKKAIASGALKVEYADKKIEYKSNTQMFEALRLMEKEVNGGTQSGRAIASFSKGLNSEANHDYLFFD